MRRIRAIISALHAEITSNSAHLCFVTIHPYAGGNGIIGRAIADLTLARSEHSPALLQHVFPTTQLNSRQRLVLNLLLDGFEGHLTTSKYAKLTKRSQDPPIVSIT
ncbi:MAG: Fic family protein [Acidobacteria bacterium]|nr:Fic family protein [Acidobacteriota bacterium]